MKRKYVRRTVLWILLMISVLHSCIFVLAHSTSQEGILAKTYIEEYDGYYIGGEDVGWSVDEGYHTNGTTLTYSFSTTDTNLTNEYRTIVMNGAAQWSGTVSIINKTDGSGTGLVSTFRDPTTSIVAVFGIVGVDNSGHLTAWSLQMNRAYTQTATILAHEFGHAIGLNDLYAAKNSGKLMYAYTSGTATGPTLSDTWGAKLIIGVHSNHPWGYKFWESTALGNMHIKYCLSCNGLTTDTRRCTYGSDKRCTVCGSNMFVPISPQ